MRVIAGKYAGLNIASPKGHKTHPMAEKVRGAIFSALGDLEGLSVFDPYGGSGAIGLEAASRGAAKVTITEIDKKAHAVIESNIKFLKAQNVKASRANCVSWVENNLDKKFDIIIADPPYDRVNPSQLNKLSAQLKGSGVFVLSFGNAAPQISNLQVIKEKDYGDAKLAFYKH